MNPYENAPPPRSTSVEHGREPCPDRILDDIGGAFGMGAAGGGLWYFFKDFRKSPAGQRLRGGLEGIRGNAPRLGGSFAIWGGLFSSFDCTLVFLRQKEDPWNSITAGALTGGVLHLRSGLTNSAKSAAFGGVLLAMIEGLQIMITKMSAPPPPRMASMQANMPPIPSGSMPPPPYGGAISPAAMATAQSQPEIIPPSFESPSTSQEQNEQQGWGSWFGFGKKSSQDDDSSSNRFQTTELK